MPEATAEFAITMTLQQARLAKPILANIGVKFEPAEDMLERDPDDDTHWVMRSSELDYLLSAIRDRLDEHHPGCTLPEPVTLEQTAEALALAYWEFEWNRHRPTEDLWRHDGGTWQQVIDKYPELFGTD